MEDEQEFCLKWGSYQDQLLSAFRVLLDQGLLVDATLSCEGRSLQAHRTILSACSNYFQNLFNETKHSHPIIILKDVKFSELEALVHFMYNGEVTMPNDSIPGFLRTADMLQIKGLTQEGRNSSPNKEMKEHKHVRSEDNENNLKNYVHTKRRRIENNPSQTTTVESSSIIDNLSENVKSEPEERVNDVETFDLISEEESEMSPGNFVGGENESLQRNLQINNVNQYCNTSASEDFGSNHSNHAAAMISLDQNLRPFRHRVLWNREQLEQLENWYHSDRYPTGYIMSEYAETLASLSSNGNAPTRQNVDYWFQNRRRKDSHPDVMQQREKKKLSKSLWNQFIIQHNSNP